MFFFPSMAVLTPQNPHLPLPVSCFFFSKSVHEDGVLVYLGDRAPNSRTRHSPFSRPAGFNSPPPPPPPLILHLRILCIFRPYVVRHTVPPSPGCLLSLVPGGVPLSGWMPEFSYPNLCLTKYLAGHHPFCARVSPFLFSV